jgi:hypothetical protein
MRIVLKGMLPIALLVLVASCARVPFEPMAAVEMPPVPKAALLEKHWPDALGVYRIRQTALLKIGFRELPMDGVLILNAREQKARLVAMSSMGIKFFDVEIIGDTVTAHYILPEFRKIGNLPERIGEAVQRLFLSPGPAPGDAMGADEKALWLTRTVDGTRYRFVFGGEHRLLASKTADGGTEKWTARYFDYMQTGNEWIPRGFTYRDARGRYALTLWTERVEKEP